MILLLLLLGNDVGLWMRVRGEKGKRVCVGVMVEPRMRGGAGRGDARLFGSSLDDGVRKILSFAAVICFHENLKIKFKIRSFASV